MSISYKKWALSAVFILANNMALAENMTIFAAASMTNVLQQIAQQYKITNPQDDLTFSFAGSSTLAKQIEQDAPADLFVSADQKWIDYLHEKLPTKIRQQKILAQNHLVLIAPSHAAISPTDIQTIDIKKLLADSYLAIGDDHVPVGRYAKKALTYLGWWTDVEPRLAKAKDVRAVLAYIERGELPLGIVYATDANISDKVKVIATFPPESYGDIVYPAVVLTENAAAQRFFDYLSSEKATQYLEQAGFQPVK